LKKEFIRKQAIKIRKTCKSYAMIQDFLERKYDVVISRKTLKRWWKRYKEGWDFVDKSRRPHTIYKKFDWRTKKKVLDLRKKTYWQASKIKQVLIKENIFISESSIKNLIRQFRLSRGSPMEGKRLKWVRWQRKHPNSLWQIDATEEKDMTWTIAVIDDCSRYAFAITNVESFSTESVIRVLERCINSHGKPREILTDNGSQFQKQFDKWCETQKIKHIRTGISRPTTTGKVERFFGTYKRELPYCHNNPEYFRYRYNFIRPHLSLDYKTPAETYFDFAKLF